MGTSILCCRTRHHDQHTNYGAATLTARENRLCNKEARRGARATGTDLINSSSSLPGLYECRGLFGIVTLPRGWVGGCYQKVGEGGRSLPKAAIMWVNNHWGAVNTEDDQQIVLVLCALRRCIRQYAIYSLDETTALRVAHVDSLPGDVGYVREPLVQVYAIVLINRYYEGYGQECRRQQGHQD